MLFEKIQLETDEHVIQIVHKHWFVIAARAVGISVVSFTPLIAWVVLMYLTQHFTIVLSINLSDYTIYFSFLFTFWLLLNWMTFANMWTTYHLDIWVITNRRVIVINQKSLFRRSVGSFRLEKLQDINIEINGIVATFLDYGVINAETASESDDDFKTYNMPHPRELKALITRAADERIQTQQLTHKINI